MGNLTFTKPRENMMTNEQVYDWIERQGATKAVVYYDGGGDEGGVDEIVLKDANDKIIRCFREAHTPLQYNEQTGEWTPRREPTEEEEASKVMCKPVYDTYHSFAGDFYVSGTVIWDAKLRNWTW